MKDIDTNVRKNLVQLFCDQLNVNTEAFKGRVGRGKWTYLIIVV